jgi:hypothetical protein
VGSASNSSLAVLSKSVLPLSSIVGAVRIAPLAPGVIGQVLRHSTDQHRDRAEVIGHEVDQAHGPARVDAFADLDIADREVVGPFRRGRARIGQIGQDAKAEHIERDALRCHLLEALMLGVFEMILWATNPGASPSRTFNQVQRHLIPQPARRFATLVNIWRLLEANQSAPGRFELARRVPLAFHCPSRHSKAVQVPDEIGPQDLPEKKVKSG